MNESKFFSPRENSKPSSFKALVPRPDLGGGIVFFEERIKALDEKDAEEKIRRRLENDYKSFESMGEKETLKDKEATYALREKLAKMEIAIKKVEQE